jgi:acyl-ACP thioesterase
MNDPALPSARRRRAEGAVDILPVPVFGRVFRATRPVRLGDVGIDGRVRLDALARYLQDVSGDDSDDADLDDALWWVVRRSVIEQHAPLRFREQVDLDTFCSGLGRRWAERRVSIVGRHGGRAETVTLWVRIDAVTGRPKPLGAQFEHLYRPSAGDREVDGRLRHRALELGEDGVEVVPWAPRVTDLDILDHVNNAIAWGVVEQAVVHAARHFGEGLPVWAGTPRRTEVEYRDPIDRSLVLDGPRPVVLTRASSDRLEVTMRGGDGPAAPVFVTAVVSAVQSRGATTLP